MAQAQFFANAVNTTNIGVDIVLNYTKRWEKQSLNLLLASNFQRMNIDKVNVPAALNNSFEEQQAFFSQREEKFIKASAPPAKIGFTADYGINKTIKVGTHLTYFGKIELLGYGYNTTYPPTVTLDADPTQVRSEQFNYNGKVVTDLYTSVKLSKVATVFVGVDNLFNIHPNLGFYQVQSYRLMMVKLAALGMLYKWEPMVFALLLKHNLIFKNKSILKKRAKILVRFFVVLVLDSREMDLKM